MSIECVSREALCSESKCELCYIVSAERNRLYFFLNYKFRKEKFNRWIRNQRRRLWLRQGIELMDLRISLSCLIYNWLSHQINRESNVTNMSEILIKQKKRWLKTCCCHVHVPKCILRKLTFLPFTVFVRKFSYSFRPRIAVSAVYPISLVSRKIERFSYVLEKWFR